MHFIHEIAKTRQSEAIPLLLVHGWPGTFFEYVTSSDICELDQSKGYALRERGEIKEDIRGDRTVG